MDSRVILITGSSRGIGAYAAEAFSEAGHSVVINCARSKEEADVLADNIRAKHAGANMMVIQADVSKRNDVKLMFDQVYDRFGKCDALVNMAGINRDAALLEMSDDDWDIVIATILNGTFLCSREFAMRYHGDSGHIINIGSVSAIRGRKNGANYCSARAGVLNLTRCMALELAPRIRVNSITPGYIDTEEVMARHSLHVQENYDRAVSQIPEGRLGKPDDMFKTINFLINDSSYITGQNIMVDGGYCMR